MSKIYKELIKLNSKKKHKTMKKQVKDLNRYFPKEDMQMVDRQVKRCSMSLIIRKMPIKTTLRYHLTPVRMASINKSTNNKCW